MKTNPISITSRCPIRTTQELLGGKWKLLIMHQLNSGGPLRPSELQTLIPDISQKMLIQELKILVDANLVERKNFGTVPPRVEYSSSTIGKDVQTLIEEMVRFAGKYEKGMIKD